MSPKVSMRAADLIVSVLLLIFSLFLMWESGEVQHWNPDVKRFDNIWLTQWYAPDEGAGSGFWPFWLSLIMAGCCVWMIVNWFRKSTALSKSTEAFLDGYAFKWVALVSVGLIVFLGLIELIGFYGAIFVFLIYYIWILGRHQFYIAFLISTVVCVVFFFFFDIAMRIVLPKGYSEPLFIPLYDIFL